MFVWHVNVRDVRDGIFGELSTTMWGDCLIGMRSATKESECVMLKRKLVYRISLVGAHINGISLSGKNSIEKFFKASFISRTGCRLKNVALIACRNSWMNSHYFMLQQKIMCCRLLWRTFTIALRHIGMKNIESHFMHFYCLILKPFALRSKILIS